MRRRSAREYFGGPERYNCAQAVSKVFQLEYDVTDADIDALAKSGAGRAPGGLCGSLYAAKQLLNDPRGSMKLEMAFQTQAGSLQCRQIRKLKKISCAETVELAAKFLQEQQLREGTDRE